MNECKKPVSEEALEKVSGGIIYDSGAWDASDLPQNCEFPIMLPSDGDVTGFVSIASGCAFDIKVRDKERTVSGKDYASVLSLNRTGFVTVMAACGTRDPFVRECERFMIF